MNNVGPGISKVIFLRVHSASFYKFFPLYLEELTFYHNFDRKEIYYSNIAEIIYL